LIGSFVADLSDFLREEK